MKEEKSDSLEKESCTVPEIFVLDITRCVIQLPSVHSSYMSVRLTACVSVFSHCVRSVEPIVNRLVHAIA